MNMSQQYENAALFCRDHSGAAKAEAAKLPWQGVRGSELFRVIFSSGIPMPFWLPVALPKPICLSFSHYARNSTSK